MRMPTPDDIFEGQSRDIFGPNGAGKPTVHNLIAGLIPSGSLRVNGWEPDGLPTLSLKPALAGPIKTSGYSGYDGREERASRSA